ncbi:hypothetical protein [Metabacillus malikii]|uniref:Uncharacterized protein n=1 Tax=Metabacillus malikii TaxID=1504265 RepID=A0ABT9ZLS9_9BACI|nr:hypothetical protein [Metabacillus malikii]MDQ0233228.1 hypothetical protein [Metabacillus malikii]
MDEHNRTNEAILQGMLTVEKSLVDSGYSVDEVSKHIPYSAEELEGFLKRFEK